MPVVALGTWFIAVLGGLILLAIWLIEYDPDFQRSAATRLPIPVISGHVTLAIGGLVVWVVYLLTDDETLAWITLADLAVVVTLGMTMAVRWIGVYRSRALPARAAAHAGSAGSAEPFWNSGPYSPAGTQPPRSGGALASELAVPPERHFPVSVVIGHGIFALTTVALVLVTTLGIGGGS